MLSHDNVKVSWFKNGVKILQSKAVDIKESGCEHSVQFNEVSLDDDDAEITIHAEKLKVLADSDLFNLAAYCKRTKTHNQNSRITHCLG